MTSPDNEYFAKSYVNRIWGYLMGVGLIEPLDDIRAGNPASNPELLAWLTDDFVSHGFDTRHLIRTICKSRVYQLSIATHAWNEDDQVNFSHAHPKRLPAEVLHDTIYFVTGSALAFQACRGERGRPSCRCRGQVGRWLPGQSGTTCAGKCLRMRTFQRVATGLHPLAGQWAYG